MKLEQTDAIKNMTDEELRAGIATLQTYLEFKRSIPLIQGQVLAEQQALPPPEPEVFPPQRKRNRLMMEADTAVGPKERSPRKRLPSAIVSPSKSL